MLQRNAAKLSQRLWNSTGSVDIGSQMSDNKVTVTLMKSPIGRLKTHKACIAGLGLRRIGQTVTVEDTPSTRGMINRISYMLQVDEQSRGEA